LTPHTHDIVKGGESAPDLGGEAGAPAIEVTPAMIAAGVSTMCEIDSSFSSDVEIVSAIYLAMSGARIKSL
jgi:hypothetical protein